MHEIPRTSQFRVGLAQAWRRQRALRPRRALNSGEGRRLWSIFVRPRKNDCCWAGWPLRDRCERRDPRGCFRRTDWVALARGMGVPAARAERAEDLVIQLKRGLAEPGPYLIEAVL